MYEIYRIKIKLEIKINNQNIMFVQIFSEILSNKIKNNRDKGVGAHITCICPSLFGGVFFFL